ncbi:MAG: zinc ABC transporter substrate-binding protein [Opitutales bacterium]
MKKHTSTDRVSLKKLIPALLAAAGALFVASCGKVASTEADTHLHYPYKVGATVGMISDVVMNVAGDNADVSGIIGEGVDPHLYKPTSSDVKMLQASDIIFYSGLNLEGKMGDVLVRMATSGKPVTAVTETLLESGKYVMTDQADHYDPHVWMDVSGWIQATGVISESLQKFDPRNAAIYQKNAAEYSAELQKLHEYGRRVFATIPKERRVLVTAHDAFNYMGRAYNLEVRGIQGISTESEAGLKDINDLVDFLVDQNIPAVFVESSVSRKNVRALIEGAKAKSHNVKIGGELFSDAMGETGTYEGTYIGMLDHNITTIVRALGGEAPAKGLNGKLSH